MSGVRRLPRGRHGLSRDEVARDQRQRMQLAMVESMADAGYVGTSVATVIGRAGVSRETFYQQFSSKLDCFLSTFDAAGEIVLETVRQAERLAADDDGQVAPIDRFGRALDAYLDLIASQPAFARLFLVESHAAGPAAIERRRALQGRIAEAMAELLALDGPDGRFSCELLVAGVGGLVVPLLVADDLDAIRALRAPVLDHVGRLLASV